MKTRCYPDCSSEPALKNNAIWLFALTEGKYTIIILLYFESERFMVRLRTKIFDMNRYKNLAELAKAITISVSQIYRVQY